MLYEVITATPNRDSQPTQNPGQTHCALHAGQRHLVIATAGQNHGRQNSRPGERGKKVDGCHNHYKAQQALPLPDVTRITSYNVCYTKLLREHMHPLLAGVIIPGVLVLFLAALPYLDHSHVGVGVWFTSKRGRWIVVWTALYTLVVMPAYVLLDNAFSLRELLRGVVPQWVAQGLLPAAIMVLLVALPALV